MRPTVVISTLLLILACDDGEREQRGRVSQGPPNPSAAVLDPSTLGPRRRFTFDTGSALDTMRATKQIRARLKPLGVPESAAQVVGDAVQVDVPEPKAAAAKAAFEGGRLDLWLADERDVFDPEEHGERFRVESEANGGQSTHFLRARVQDKDALLAYVNEHAEGKQPLIGSIHEKGALVGYRSYLAEPDQQTRGEYLTSATVDKDDLVLRFEAAGMSFIHWTSKQRGRLLVLVDGEVIGAVQTNEVIKDGVLQVAVPGRAEALAKLLHGRALGHATKLVEEKALDGQ